MNIKKDILKIGVPIVLMNVFNTVIMNTDSFITGKFLGLNKMTSISLSVVVVYRMMLLFKVMKESSVILLNKEELDKNETRFNLFLIAIVLSLLNGFICLFFKTNLTSTINVPEILYSDYSIYYDYYVIASCLCLLSEFLATMLIAEGDSKTPARIMIISQLVNIGLDIVIVQFSENVKYLALTTILGYVIATTWLLIKIKIKLCMVKLSYFRDFFKIGIPMLLSEICYTYAILVTTKTMNSFSLEEIKATTISNELKYLANAVTSIAYTPMLVLLSSKKYRVKECLTSGLKFIVTITLVSNVIVVGMMFLYAMVITKDKNVLDNLLVASIPIIGYVFIAIKNNLIAVYTHLNLQKYVSAFTFLSIFLFRVAYLKLLADNYLMFNLANPLSWICLDLLLIVSLGIIKRKEIIKNRTMFSRN